MKAAWEATGAFAAAILAVGAITLFRDALLLQGHGRRECDEQNYGGGCNGYAEAMAADELAGSVTRAWRSGEHGLLMQVALEIGGQI